MSLKDIRERLLLIVNTIDAVAGTRFTLAEKVPSNRQDFEGWVCWVRHTRSAKLPATSQDRVRRTSTWIIEITSPQITTGFPAQREIQSVEYASALDELFDIYTRLEHPTTRVGLTGVVLVETSDVVTRAPRAYPDGSPQQYYSIALTLTVETSRSKAC